MQSLVEALGMAKRNDVLARIYLVRCDTSYGVRQAAVHVWKTVVVNTPRTLRDVLPRLLELCIENISGEGEEGQQTASRCLGELVRALFSSIVL